MSNNRSVECKPVDNSWLANWRLLRSLYTDWNPTDDEAQEVWWAAWNKPHAISGAGTVNHEALRAAIVTAKRSSLHRNPPFHLIANEYRVERHLRSSLRPDAPIRKAADAERTLIEREREARLRRVLSWPDDRLDAAMAEVGRRFDTFRGKSKDPDSWSPTYVAFLIVADEDLNEPVR